MWCAPAGCNMDVIWKADTTEDQGMAHASEILRLPNFCPSALETFLFLRFSSFHNDLFHFLLVSFGMLVYI
jgi:hypothetical protein